LERIVDELKLSRQNRDKAHDILRAHHEKMRKLHEQAREDLLKQMKDVLSEEQLKEFKEALERRPPPPPPGGPGRSPQGVSVEDLVERVMAFDKNGDGKVTKEELPERMHHLLELGDTNKDGALDKEELKKLAEKLRQEGPPRGPRGPGGRGNPPPPPPPPEE
jgi:Ca2+-binding EF-hand superfamily protein